MPTWGRGDEPLDEEVPRPRHVERRREQVGEVVDDDAPRAQQGGERVVLGLRTLRPQDVVEEQAAHVGRREPAQLEPRPVEDDLAQDADL